MAIVQNIEFNSENRYFAGFLQSLIDEVGINGSVSFEDRKIKLTLDDKDVKALEKFSELSTKYLPHSFFLGKIETTSEDVDVQKSSFKSPNYNIAPCPKCLEMISDPASSHYLDDSLTCTHYSNEGAFFEDTATFSPHYTEGSMILLTDPSKIDELFIMTKKEKELLFSIEKPTIKVTIKDEELKKETKKSYIYLKAPYSIKSTLASINAKDSGMSYLYFFGKDDLKAIRVQDNISIIKASRVATPLKELDSDRVINRFLNIAKEADFSEALGVNLSLTNGINFLIKNDKVCQKTIIFNEFVLGEVLQKMKDDEIRAKLLQNFQKAFPDVLKNLQNSPKASLFETIAMILELDFEDNAFEAVSDKSLEFRGNGGLKIDTNFNQNEFDYASFIGSIMSFKLGGSDDFYVAYSIFEALGDMSISVLNQLKTKFKISNFIMMGDMFSNAVLYSRILSKFQLSNPYFSKSIALDD